MMMMMSFTTTREKLFNDFKLVVGNFSPSLCVNFCRQLFAPAKFKVCDEFLISNKTPSSDNESQRSHRVPLGAAHKSFSSYQHALAVHNIVYIDFDFLNLFRTPTLAHIICPI